MTRLLLILVLLFPLASMADSDLYRVTTLRAAPGQWVELKNLIEGQGEAGGMDESGRSVPYRLRHSLGAQWDFMLIQPVSEWESYFSDKTQALESDFREKVAELADFSEDWFVVGPEHDVIRAAYPDAGTFYVEMYRARAGLKAALVDSRLRENAVLEAIEIPANYVFIGEFGADWDVMTIGFYVDGAHFGTAGDGVAPDVREAAARAHGFAGMGDLAPQLRSLLTQHNDTLATRLD